MRKAGLIMIILLCVSFAFSLEEYTNQQIIDMASTKDLSIVSSSDLKSFPNNFNFNNLNSNSLQQLLNNDELQYSFSQDQIAKAVDAYAVKALGKSSGAIRINQPGATLSATKGKLEIKYGSSGTLVISKGDSIAVVETMSQPEKYLRVKRNGMNVDLRAETGTGNFKTEVMPDGKIKLTSSMIGTTYSMPPIECFANCIIYSDGNTLYVGNDKTGAEKKTYMITNADLLSKDTKTVIQFNYKPDGQTRLKINSYNVPEGVTIGIQEDGQYAGGDKDIYAIKPGQGTTGLLLSIGKKGGRIKMPDGTIVGSEGVLLVEGKIAKMTEMTARPGGGLTVVNNEAYIFANSVDKAVGRNSVLEFEVIKQDGQKYHYGGSETKSLLAKNQNKAGTTSSTGSDPGINTYAQGVSGPDSLYLARMNENKNIILAKPDAEGYFQLENSGKLSAIGNFSGGRRIEIYAHLQTEPVGVYTSERDSTKKVYFNEAWGPKKGPENRDVFGWAKKIAPEDVKYARAYSDADQAYINGPVSSDANAVADQNMKLNFR